MKKGKENSKKLYNNIEKIEKALQLPKNSIEKLHNFSKIENSDFKRTLLYALTMMDL